MKIRIPPTLRPATGGEREVAGRGDTVRELLDDLMSRFPALDGQLQYANVYVDGEDIRTLDELETPVREGATVILLPAMAGGCLTTVRELYEFWGAESYAALEARARREPRSARARTGCSSSSPRSGPGRATSSLDVGARDGKHLRRLVEEHGVEGIALDPVPQADDVVEGAIEALPLADASVDWIWCRDMLVHVDVERGLAECAPRAEARRPDDRLRHARDRPARAARGGVAHGRVRACDPRRRPDRARCRCAGLDAEKAVLGGEWRERMIEDGEWDANEALLRCRASGAAA